jgi:hypothetical protein
MAAGSMPNTAEPRDGAEHPRQLRGRLHRRGISPWEVGGLAGASLDAAHISASAGGPDPSPSRWSVRRCCWHQLLNLAVSESVRYADAADEPVGGELCVRFQALAFAVPKALMWPRHSVLRRMGRGIPHEEHLGDNAWPGWTDWSTQPQVAACRLLYPLWFDLAAGPCRSRAVSQPKSG